MLLKGDYAFAPGVLLPVQDSWLASAAALTFEVVGGREGRCCSHPNQLRLMPIMTALFSTPIVEPAHISALKRFLFLSSGYTLGDCAHDLSIQTKVLK